MNRVMVLAGSAIVMAGAAIYLYNRAPAGPTDLSKAALPSVTQSGDPLCQVPPDWLPNTPAPSETMAPLPHPVSDCGFYRPAWQRFLQVTQPAADNTPAFLGYASFAQLFLNQSAAGLELTDTLQASLPATDPGTLIDQHGRFVYYAIHINASMADYLRKSNLNTLAGLANISAAPAFPTGQNFIELKSAWMIVDDPKAASNYFVTQAKVPHFSVLNGKVTRDSQPQPTVWVALLALHVVFTLPDHPELIWSSFEHVHLDQQGNPIRDNAPAAVSNPSSTPPDTVISTDSNVLYAANTKASAANRPAEIAFGASAMASAWDDTAQAFVKGGKPLQTSVYRPYPFSKTDAGKQEEDGDVIAINDNMSKLFAAGAKDVRSNYRLVGAVWLDDPKNFVINKQFKNPIDQSTDDKGALIAGEGRLGSTAIESFTETEDSVAGGAPNCFSCHDTRAIRRRGGTPILPQSLLNVSHLMSKFKDSNPTGH
jgi:hypothetical protein